MKHTDRIRPQRVKKSRAQVAALKQPKTARKRAEDALRSELKEHQQRQAEISALLEGSRAVLNYREFKDAARAIFDSCKKLTGATGGYVAMTSEDGTGNDLLFLDPGGRACTVNRSLPMPIRGLRGEAYRTGKAVYHNDFTNSEWVKYVPEGHVTLDSILFAPLVIEGKTVGLLGLANKPGGFTENDARIASAFGELAAIALLNSRTLEALAHSEERFRAVAQSATDAVISINQHGEVIFWNAVAQAIFGWPESEMLGKPLDRIYPERFRADHRAGIERVASTGEARLIGKTTECIGLRRDGSEFPIELSLSKWQTREGIFFTGIVRDITERKRAEEEYRTIISTAMDGFWITDMQGRFLDVNDAYCHLIGYSREELLKMGVQDVEAAEKPEETAQHVQKVMEIGYDRFETQHRCKNGRVVDIEVSANFTPSQDGRFYVFLRDITARKRVEEEIYKLNAGLEQRVIERTAQLRESETRYRIVADNTYDWEFWLSPEGRFIYTSPSCERITGHTPEEFAADPGLLLRIVHPDDRPQWDQHRRETAQGKITEEIEFRVLRRDGTARWIGHACQPVFDDAGRFIGTRGSNRDITERKRAEETLKNSEASLANAQRIAHLGNWAWDIQTNELRWSDEIYRIFGLAPQEFGATYEAFLNSVHPADVEFVKQSVDAALNERKPYSIDHCIILPDGTERVVHEQAEVTFDAAGKPIRMVGTVHDITERKRVEEALRTERGLFIGGPTVVFKWKAQEGWPVEYVSPNVTSQFGHNPDDLTSGKIRYVAIIHPDDLARVGEEVTAYSQAGVAYFEQEYRIAREDGQYRWVYDFTVVIRDSHGAITHYHGYVADITDRKIAEEQIERQIKNLNALHTIDTAIAGSLDLRLTLNIALEQITTQLGMDAADVLLLNPHTQTLEYASGRGFRSKAIERSRCRLGEGHGGRAALERRTVHISDLSAAIQEFVRAELLSGEDFVTYTGVPLIAKGEVKGMLEVYRRTPFDPSTGLLQVSEPEWLSFLEILAGQVAVAVDSAQLFTGLQRSNIELSIAYDTTIEGWSRALDLRDEETEGHTQRVTELTLQLARGMGMSEAELVHIRRGCLLHDIGKMGIPDNILRKPGPLTDEEWVIMRKHPQYAFEMLSPIAYLRPALDIPGCHHEKWDGSGYPRGLKGEQIPLAARIFAVIDVYDALTSDRPYRKAWPEEKCWNTSARKPERILTQRS